MVGLIILGIIVAIIAAIMLVPVGADVEYEGGEFKLSAKVCGILLQLLPKKPVLDNGHIKEKKPKKEQKKKEKPADGEAKPKKKFKLQLNRDEILALVKTALRSLSKFGKVTVDRFKLHYIAGGSDPYDTAMTYNYVNAALSGLGPFCKTRFIVHDVDVYTDVDFAADKMQLDFGLCIVIRIGQVMRVAFALLFGALWILIKNQVRLKVEKFKNRKNPDSLEKSNEPETSGEIINTETNKENIQDNERNDSNG